MNKKVVIPIVAVVLILVGFWVWKSYFGKDFKYAGTVEVTRIDLPARVATVVDSVLVHEGEAIKAGQLLIKLSCDEVGLQQKLASENFERAEKLKQTGSVSKEAYDLALNKKQEADTRQSWCEVKSPVDGVVLTRFLEPSEWVSPGTKLLTVADVTDLWVYFYVPQEIMSKLEVGQNVTGVVPELSKNFSGKIIKINSEAEFTPKNVQTESERTRLIFGIKVSFHVSDLQLKPGMTIESDLAQAN